MEFLTSFTRNDALQSKSRHLSAWGGMIPPAGQLTIPLFVLTLVLLSVLVVAPVFAIDLPDSTPTIIGKWAWRHVLESNDMLVIIYENTPYTTTPDIDYSEAFNWEYVSTNGSVTHGVSQGYDYNDKGYGYNVIGYYFPAAEVASENITWGAAYQIQMVGSPVHFTTIPEYIFSMNAADYSALTDAEDIQTDIEQRILLLAADLNTKWALGTTYSLLSQTETGTVLSIYGEAFFRGALYGVQGYAPNIFSLVISSIDTSVLSDRTWSDNYSSNLTSQYAGTDIDTGMTAGNALLDVSYNLFGLLITLGIMAAIVIISLVIGGDFWGAFVGCVAPAVICTRIGLFGMGELALIAAVCWLFLSAKVWKLI